MRNVGEPWRVRWMDGWSLYSSAAQEKTRPAYHEETICAMYPLDGKIDNRQREEE